MQAAEISSSTGSSTVAASESLAHFAENGYFVLRNVVPKRELSALADQLYAAFAAAMRDGGLFTGGGLMAGHINCSPGEPSRFAFDALKSSGVIDLVRQLAPTAVDSVRAGCNLNFPNSVAQNWHIDGDFRREFFIANVAVVDTDLVNGATDILPRSHREARPYWRLAVNNDFKGHLRTEMQQGDVLVRTSRLWHRGMPNRSAVARPMLGFTFGEGLGGPEEDPFRINDGAITFYPNRFRTDMLGQLRERSYVVAPFAHTAFRFVRSVFGKDGYA